MKIYDISMTITDDMPVYAGKASKRPFIGQDLENSGHTVYESKLIMNLHTGTHVDAPLHMMPGGARMDFLALEQVVTRCKVFDLSEVAEAISADHLADRGITAGDFVLLKTRNSYEDILEGSFVYLDRTGAAFLQELGVIGVGTDGLGIERAQPDHATHETLLGNGIVVIEGLRLAHVPDGEYLLVALPLKILDTEAAPMRAILIDD